MRITFGKSITGMLMLLSTLATATNSASSNMNGFEDCRRASENELKDMRGGFLINAEGMQFLLSLGIERVTYVNGALVAMSTFNLLPQLNSSGLRSAIYSQVNTTTQQQVPSTALPATVDIVPAAGTAPAKISVASAPASSSAMPIAQNTPAASPTAAPENYQPIQVIQIGPGNTFTPPSATNLPSGTMAVIQNTLDNQVIRNMTIINATLASRELIRSMALNSILNRIPANFGR